MQRVWGLVFFVTWLALAGLSVDSAAGDKAALSGPLLTFEGGSLYRSGRIDVLDLHGSWRQMGRQYGRLLADELQDLYQRAVVACFMEGKGLAPEDMTRTADALFRLYPQRFKDILLGMAETSGLSADQQILLNALELYGTMPGCSGIFTWGEYTAGGSLMAGRNYDWFDSYVDFARNLTVTVFHPDSGIPTAIVTFAGVIYVTTAMNEQGLFLELNNGLPSGGGLTFTNRVPAIANLFAFLVDYQTLEQLDAAFQSTRPDFTFIINAADSRAAFSYEWPPFDLKRRAGDAPGLLVATNHFANPAWGVALQPDTGFQSVLRRDNLLSLAHKHKGKINLAAMMRILDTPMDQGGATWPREGSIRTVYQIIAMPEDRQLWVKVPGHQDWTPVDLKTFFSTKQGAAK